MLVKYIRFQLYINFSQNGGVIKKCFILAEKISSKLFIRNVAIITKKILRVLLDNITVEFH